MDLRSPVLQLRLFLILLLGGSLFGCSSTPETYSSDDNSNFAQLSPQETWLPPDLQSEVPLSIDRRRTVVEVDLGPAGKYPFQFDTGAEMGFVSRAIVSRLDLPTRESLISLDTPSGTSEQTFEIVRIPSISIGEAEFRDIDFLVHDFDPELGGLLSLSLFHDLLFTLDYPRRVLRLEAPRAVGELNDFDRVEFHHRRPVVPLRLGGSRFDAVVDTGMSHSLLLTRQVAKKVSTQNTPVRAAQFTSVNATVVASVARATHDLTVANRVVEKPIFFIGEEATESLLGTEILRHFQLSCQPRDQLLRLRSPNRSPIRMAAWQGYGYRVETDPDNGAERIADVFGSKAKKTGIKTGDIILGQWRLQMGDEPSARLPIFIRAKRPGIEQPLEFIVPWEILTLP